MTLSQWKRYRLKVVMWFARKMGVPVEVHQKYFGDFARQKKGRAA